MKPRAAWPLLAKKAKEKCDLIQVEVVKARERIKHLESSKERMVLLYQDYVQRSKEAERKPHSMAETLNFRSFMLQLQELIQRVDRIEQTGEHAFLRSNFVCGIKRLPVRMHLI